jgi:hypothetical protein
LLCRGTGSGMSELRSRIADRAIVLQQIHGTFRTARTLLRDQSAWRALLPRAMLARCFLQLCGE